MDYKKKSEWISKIFLNKPEPEKKILQTFQPKSKKKVLAQHLMKKKKKNVEKKRP